MIRIPFTKWVLIKVHDNVPMPGKLSEATEDFEHYVKPTGNEFIDMHVACLRERNLTVVNALQRRTDVITSLEQAIHMITNLVEFGKERGHEIADPKTVDLHLQKFKDLVWEHKQNRHNRIRPAILK